ncbi:hypothetical protein BDU57DRAFT_528608 [Ampelomyces quisqualis]|uniref:Uncharacterized protein n=1 Tax=Ampelomyces quisqualis TaxID=50730 RepID=A0A6A5QR53_AMPQU|nr:hypothetical protein BDU57DRAFT_528608 [Ampelomyces quisqualis]
MAVVTILCLSARHQTSLYDVLGHSPANHSAGTVGAHAGVIPVKASSHRNPQHPASNALEWVGYQNKFHTGSNKRWNGRTMSLVRACEQTVSGDSILRTSGLDNAGRPKETKSPVRQIRNFPAALNTLGEYIRVGRSVSQAEEIPRQTSGGRLVIGRGNPSATQSYSIIRIASKHLYAQPTNSGPAQCGRECCTARSRQLVHRMPLPKRPWESR